MLRAILEAEQHLATKARPETVRLARNGIGFVQIGGNAAPPRGGERRYAGESAHTEHGIGTKTVANRAALAVGGEKALRELEHRGRKDGSQSDRRECLTRHVGKSAQRALVDRFLRDEKKHLVLRATEFLGDSQPGE